MLDRCVGKADQQREMSGEWLSIAGARLRASGLGRSTALGVMCGQRCN